MISQRLTGVWSQTFENRLLAVVVTETEGEDSVRLSTGEVGVSNRSLTNSSLSCYDSISEGCEVIVVIYSI